ncbi:YihY/virulence factor BrkB family protein [Falsiroseomonas sp.]|uniref:YihY/virulence factor BrkB family protein n=1 Tax=Falsiroseomonas sp. TaxID=2870721 RepID=UPI00272457E0|nr:YihY/virulence factor BrkB family protein [Falsiroseomonas sp.]MDO9502807.1 YihY/virulence factor BrkB family protein [Falsiroseomonas sp.]
MVAAAALAGLLALDSALRRPGPAAVRRGPHAGPHLGPHAGRDRRQGHPAGRSPEPTSGKPAEAGAGAGAGRSADGPSQIPARGWWQILKRTASQASEDRLMMEAAAVTFYTLLALFPALASLVSIYALVADPATIQGHLSALGGIVPGGGMEIIEEQVQRVASTAGGTLGFGAAAGLLISLWSSNQAAKAMFDALNIIYEEREKRGFIKLTLTTLTFTLGFFLFAILTMVAVVAVPVVLGLVGLGSTAEMLLSYGRWPLMLLLVGLVLACLYRWGPSRAEAKWRWVSWGSGFAAVAWLAASAGFSWYVANFGNYNETYGSLGAVIGFMTWIWISAIVILLGAELNAEMEHQTAQDTTTAPDQALGRRGAEMADTVA